MISSDKIISGSCQVETLPGYSNTRIGKELMKSKDKAETKMIRFVLTSDTHGKHRQLEVPKGDVLLHCGDFTNYGGRDEVRDFSDWLAGLDFKHKIIVAGNHDYTFDFKKEAHFKEILKHNKQFENEACFDFQDISSELRGCTYLEDSSTEVFGYKIYGTPYQLEYTDSAFQVPESKLMEVFKKIPLDTQILMTHSAPHSICDTGKLPDMKCGSKSLFEISRSLPALLYHVFGHTHESYGSHMPEDGAVYLNACFCFPGYSVGRLPFVFDLPDRSK